jgi:hypothetical protein
MLKGKSPIESIGICNIQSGRGRASHAVGTVSLRRWGALGRMKVALPYQGYITISRSVLLKYPPMHGSGWIAGFGVA